MTTTALPALRAKMGDWVYYVTAMTFRELSESVHYARELYPHTELDDVIQRELSKRGKSISEYLLGQGQRFFGAMILAVADGAPKFIDVKVVDPTLTYARTEGLGLVVFDGTQKYFALDGQHRLSAMRLAIEKNPALESEQVSVIFVQHKNTKEGKGRTRRLFTTLNRYAKAISKMDAIAMDEDDAVAVTTRRLIRTHGLFRGKRLSISAQKAISPQDRVVFTNAITIYDATELVLKSKKWPISKKFKQWPRPLNELEEMFGKALRFWEGLCNSIEPIKKIDGATSAPFPSDLRSSHGGHLLFRPIGLTTYARAYRMAVDAGLSEERAHSRLAKVDYDLNSPPWPGVVWHPGKRRMLYKKDNEMLCTKLLAYLIGINGKTALLREEYREMLSVTKVRHSGRLPRPLF